MRSLFRGPVSIRCQRLDGVWGNPNEVFVILVRPCKLEHGIVDKVGERKGRDRCKKRCRRDVIRSFNDRPFALPLAQTNPMLYDFRLCNADLKGLLQRIFSRCILFLTLQNAAELDQTQKLIFHRLAIHDLQAFDESNPGGNCSSYLTPFFENSAQINIGWSKIRVEPYAFSKSIHGPGAIAQTGERDGIIEIDGIKEGVASVKGYPGLV